MKKKNIYRSEANRIIGGVCGGIGEYFDIDPVIVRIIFVLLAIFGGSGIPLYIILWLVIPTESKIEEEPKDTIKNNIKEMKSKVKSVAGDLRTGDKDSSRQLFGIFIIILGGAFLLQSFGIITGDYISKLWPLLLIFVGFLILKRHEERK